MKDSQIKVQVLKRYSYAPRGYDVTSLEIGEIAYLPEKYAKEAIKSKHVKKATADQQTEAEIVAAKKAKRDAYDESAQVAAASDLVQEKQSQLNAANGQIAEAENSLKKLQKSTNSAIGERDTMIASLESELETTKETIETHEATIADLVESTGDVAGLKESLEVALTTVSEGAKEIEKASIVIAELSKERDETKILVESLETSVKSWEEHLVTANNTIEEHVATIAERDETIVKLKSDLETATKSN